MDLNQVTVPSVDLYKAEKFYKKLGLVLIVDSKPDYLRFSLPAGNSTFSIHKVDSVHHSSAGPLSNITLYFEIKELDQKVNELIKKGIKFDEMPNDKTWLWKEAHLRDPDGNYLILYYAGENRKSPPWKI